MKKTTLFVLLFLFVSLPLIFLGAKYLPIWKNKIQQKTSDAKDLKGKITLAIDDWIGYYPISSSRMKKSMRSEGVVLDCLNDGGDYPTRMKQLQEGKLDFAVVTVDSYILNASPVDFPGTIIAILDESKGDDTMVADTNVVQNLDSFKTVKALKIAYTAGSPSHHFLKSIASHFNVPALKNLGKDRRFETKDSQEALKLLQEKKVSVAILWEPNVSKALELPWVGKIIGTESTSRLIVDILVVNRDFASKKPEQVDLLLRTYFRTLKFYADDPEQLRKDIHAELKLPSDSIQTMLDGVAWINLTENCQEWFGISGPGQTAEQGLVDTISSTVSILVESGDFKEDPLPDKDPYRIINSSFIQNLYNTGIKTGFASLAGVSAGSGEAGSVLSHSFKQLSDAQWAKLKPVGSIKVEPLLFQTGLSDLAIPEKEKLDVAMNRLKHYPTFRIRIDGHTSSQGDASANLALSQDRADAVARYLTITYSIDPNRLKTVGYGGTKPLPRQPDESDRAYGYRLPRVEITLAAESF